MISDNDLYSLAIFLGATAMILIVVYHYFEVNAVENEPSKVPATDKKSAN